MGKKLKFNSIVLLTINSIIGTGIFLSPGSVVKSAGANALLVYVFAAIFASVLALTFAAAAKYVASGGAAYAYTKAAFGDRLGLYIGVTRYMAACIAWGVMGTAVVKSILSIFSLDSNNLTYVTIGFIILMLVLMVINLVGSKVFEIINNLSTYGKVGALLLTIVMGAYSVFVLGNNNFNQVYSIVDSTQNVIGSNMTLSSWVMATISAFYAFTGFESVASGSQDMEEPEKNLPKAIPLAIGIIAVVYIGVVGIAMMVNPNAIVNATQVVVLAEVFDNPIVRNLIVVGALISMFGINVAASFHTPRILDAMAIQKQVPTFLGKRTSSNYPLVAFFVTIAIAIILPFAFQFNMTSIIVLSSISRFVQFIVVPAAVIVFYYGKSKQPILENVSKNRILDVFIPIISLLLTILLLFNFNWTAQFTTTNADGATSVNTLAIIAMILGYVVLPVMIIFFQKKEKNNQ